MTDDILKLREMTGAGMLASKQALKEAGGDLDKAIEILRKKGAATAGKKASRQAKQGLVDSYIHAGGKVGVLIEVNCETDFVAKTDYFKEFVHEMALQVVATAPRWISEEDVPGDVKEKEERLAGSLPKFYEENCLLNQKYIKDETKTVQNLLTELIARTGENVKISRFSRFVLGGE